MPPAHSVIFLLVLAVVIIGGMFIFNLTDKVFGNPKSSQIEENPQILTSNRDQSTVFENDYEIIEEIPLVETSVANNHVKPQEFENLALQEYKKEKLKKSQEGEKLRSIILELEKNYFYLEGSGRAWEGAPHLGKPSKIFLKLNPVKGSELNKFDLVEGKIIIGESSFNFKNGYIEINNSEIILEVVSDQKQLPSSYMKGIIDSSIKNSKYLGQVEISDQLFFLSQGSRVPFHLNYDATIYSTN